MVSLFHLQQRQQVCRPYRPYPGKLPQPYHQILYGASTPPIFLMNSCARPGGHGTSAKLFVMVAIVVSLALCFMAAAARSATHSPDIAADEQSARLTARPASWAGAYTIFAPRARGTAAGRIDLSDGSVFEIAATAAPVGQTTTAQTVPSNVAGGLIYALSTADKEQAAHAVGGGKAALQELPAQAAVVELPPTDPASVALSKPRLPPGLESEMEAMRAAAVVNVEEVASRGVTTGQPPPGDHVGAARAAVALPRQATKDHGVYMEEDAQPERAGGLRPRTKRTRRRDAVYFGGDDEREEEDDDYGRSDDRHFGRPLR